MWRFIRVRLQNFWGWLVNGTDWSKPDQVPFVVEWDDYILYRGICDAGLQYMQIDLFRGRNRKYVVVATSSGRTKLGVLRFNLSTIREVYQ